MGCGGNSSARPVQIPKNFTIHGNILDTQTRSMMAMCEVSGTKYILNSIEPLKGDNSATRYLAINPTGHIPMLEEGFFKVLGGNQLIYIFMVKNKSSIAEKLYPEDLEPKIKSIIGWHHAKMSTPGQQMFRMFCDSTAFPNPPAQQAINKWKTDMVNNFGALDKKLDKQTYLCGDKMTIGDIVVYNELIMFNALLDISTYGAEYSPYNNLAKWMQTMSGDSHISQLEADMKKDLKTVKRAIQG